MTHRILVIDGFEQLSRWRRFWIKRQCRRLGSGLLVTAHEPVGLPELYRTHVAQDAARRVVDHLTRACSRTVRDEDIYHRLAAQQGTLREVLFDLYDLHELRRRDCSNLRATTRKPETIASLPGNECPAVRESQDVVALHPAWEGEAPAEPRIRDE